MGETGMIAGTEQVATEEHSLPRMSDGENNDDLYDSDAPSEESERVTALLECLGVRFQDHLVQHVPAHGFCQRRRYPGALAGFVDGGLDPGVLVPNLRRRRHEVYDWGAARRQ